MDLVFWQVIFSSPRQSIWISVSCSITLPVKRTNKGTITRRINYAPWATINGNKLHRIFTETKAIALNCRVVILLIVPNNQRDIFESEFRPLHEKDRFGQSTTYTKPRVRVKHQPQLFIHRVTTTCAGTIGDNQNTYTDIVSTVSWRVRILGWQSPICPVSDSSYRNNRKAKTIPPKQQPIPPTQPQGKNYVRGHWQQVEQSDKLVSYWIHSTLHLPHNLINGAGVIDM
jgi:hypothetical protein